MEHGTHTTVPSRKQQAKAPWWDPPPFANAPIAEALLDIRVSPSEAVSLEVLARLHGRIKSHFPAIKQRASFQLGVHGTEAGLQFTHQMGGPDGYLFLSSDEKKIVQARLDGFTLSLLQPYTNWAAFKSGAQELWRKYVRLAKPREVTRIALRYVNRIRIPLPISDFKEYLATSPDLGADLPPAVSSFFMRLEIPCAEDQAAATVTEFLEPREPEAQALSVIIDIDVFQAAPYEPTSTKIWQQFNVLRRVKNRIFFGSLTDKAKEMFK